VQPLGLVVTPTVPTKKREGEGIYFNFSELDKKSIIQLRLMKTLEGKLYTTKD
jgi:hypothetical protein